jgi:hypothetical protein
MFEAYTGLSPLERFARLKHRYLKVYNSSRLLIGKKSTSTTVCTSSRHKLLKQNIAGKPTIQAGRQA